MSSTCCSAINEEIIDYYKSLIKRVKDMETKILKLSEIELLFVEACTHVIRQDIQLDFKKFVQSIEEFYRVESEEEIILMPVDCNKWQEIQNSKLSASKLIASIEKCFN